MTDATNDQTITHARAAERDEVLDKARRAKDVTMELARYTSERKNRLLLAAAEALVEKTPEILEANEADIKAGRERGLDESLIDRLKLDAERIEGIAGGLRQVAALQDPVGEVLRGSTLPNGIKLEVRRQFQHRAGEGAARRARRRRCPRGPGAAAAVRDP